jgi:undecaprenyl diphosphate synthase
MKVPVHLGIIMDGNRRWATQRGLPGPLGHRAGLQAVRRAVEAVRKLEIPYLTLYAFSSDNWQRGAGEVRAIFGLLDKYLVSELDLLIEHGVRVQVIGRRDRLPKRTQRLIELAEERTAGGTKLLLRLAVDYSSRDALVATAQALAEKGSNARLDRAAFFAELSRQIGSPLVPDIDLVIRTSGEQRLSDFCLWECAYAELWFTPTLWPDFTEATLAHALDDFARRERRFGATREDDGEGLRRAAAEPR